MSACSHAHTQCGRVTQRCHNRNPRWETGFGRANDVTHRKRTEDLGNFEKVSWVLPREKTVGFRLFVEARLVALWRVPHVLGWGANGKVIIERLRISLPYVETFNSKVIKRFRSWTKKSLRVFRVSGFLYYMYICYEHSIYVSHIHIMGMVHIRLQFNRCHRQLASVIFSTRFKNIIITWGKVKFFIGHKDIIIYCYVFWLGLLGFMAYQLL